ncbi:MAG: ferritin family protein [Planctomycetota bacterium]|nr:ferritin family protein [Planctomycetota bacterium]
MQEFKSVNDILDFAIKNEQDSYDLYMKLAKDAENPATKKFLEELAEEETSHKEKLLSLKEEGTLEPDKDSILDLKISDYLVDVEPGDSMDYTKTLIYAIKAEKAEFRLYMDMANKANDPNIRKALKMLAQEEAKHKLRLEIEYDDYMDE